MISKESHHYGQRIGLLRRVDSGVRNIPGVVMGDDIDRETLGPRNALHYVWEREVELSDGTIGLIDVHHFRNVGITKMFPTIVRLCEYKGDEAETHIFSIDNNGNVLAHTRVQNHGKAGEIETRDTSIERLLPYEDAFDIDTGLLHYAWARLDGAFLRHKKSSKA